jgi:hypothetical protein
VHPLTFITQLDWASFFPNLIVAGFTGLVVGIILNAVQRKTERRREQFEVELLWEEFRREVQGVVWPGSFEVTPWIGNFKGTVAFYTDPLLNLTKGRRLSSWAATLQDPEIALLRDVSNDMMTARALADQWGPSMQAAGKAALPTLGYWVNVDVLIESKVFGRSDEETILAMGLQAMPQQGDGTGATFLLNHEVEKLLKNNPNIRREGEALVSILKRIETSYAALRAGMDPWSLPGGSPAISRAGTT